MKIQWHSDHLRVRLNPGDLKILEREGILLERLTLPSGGWTFRLERGECSVLEFKDENLTFSLSELDFARLLELDCEGVYFDGALEFCVEKDRHTF